MRVPAGQQRMGIVGIVISHIFLHHIGRAAVKGIIASHAVKILLQIFLFQLCLLELLHIGIYIAAPQIPQGKTHIYGFIGPCLFDLLVLCHILPEDFHGFHDLAHHYIILFVAFICIFLDGIIEERLIGFLKNILLDICSFQAPLIQVSQFIADAVFFLFLLNHIIDDPGVQIIPDADDPFRIVCPAPFQTAVPGRHLQCVKYGIRRQLLILR